MLRGRLFIIFLVFLCLGCGGEESSLGEGDLTGLEGTWDMIMVRTGEITWPSDTESYDATFDVEVSIEQDSVKFDQKPVEYSYDGSTLLITDGAMWKDSSPCGNANVTTIVSLRFPLSPTGTSAALAGSQDYQFDTQYCGIIQGTTILTGTLTKR